METGWLTEEQLIEAAQIKGCEKLTHWKVERWHKEDVLPRPRVEHLGYGNGTRSLYLAETVNQLLAVCRLLRTTRHFARIRFQLWQEGYPIALPVLKLTICQLVPQFQWTIPRRESQKYASVRRQVNLLLKKLGSPFLRVLLKQFGENFEDLRSFFELQLYLQYDIRVFFEPSTHEEELSAADILARGLGMQYLSFLPADLSMDFQRLSDQGLISIPQMRGTLDAASEDELRQANSRSEVIVLLFEVFELMGMMPSFMRPLFRERDNPSLQALALVFVLHLTKHGYADNIDQLLAVLRIQVPRFRVFQRFWSALQQELPLVAKELDTLQRVWQQIKGLSEEERERYMAQKYEHAHQVYMQYQSDLDAFWQRHPDLQQALET